MPNKSKIKGDTFERQVVHLAEQHNLSAYRNRMSRAMPGESWDVCIAGRRIECKKRHAGFKKISQWMIGNDGVILGADYEKPFIVLKLDDFLNILTH